MKRFKQIAALLLAAVLTLSMSLPAMAASPGNDEEYGTKDDTGTITVSGLKDDAGTDLTVTAYPIILAQYDESGNFCGYISLYPNIVTLDDDPETGVLKTDDDGNLSYEISEQQLDAIHDLIRESENGAVQVENGKVTVDGVEYTVGDAAESNYRLKVSEDTEASMEEQETSYQATADSVAVGSYLIDIQGAEAYEYNVAVASIYYTNKDGQNAIDDPGSVNMMAEENAWVKAELPTDDKRIVGVNGETPYTNHDDSVDGVDRGVYGTTANIGDVIDFEVWVKEIPHYGGDYPTFEVIDHLSEGLEYNTRSLEVYVYHYTGVDGRGDPVYTWVVLTEGEDYTLEYDPDTNTITVNFVVDGKYTLNGYEGEELSIEYQATLTDDAALNDLDNPNQVDLIYTTDSTINADEVYGPYNPDNPDEDDPRTHERHRTHTYTFDIDGQLDGEGGLVSEGGESTGGKGSLTWDIVTKDGPQTETVYYGPDGNVISEEDYNSYSPEVQTQCSVVEINLPLNGAEFTIYDDGYLDALANTEDDDDPDDHIYKNSAMSNEEKDYWENPVTSDKYGKLTIVGLAEGTYYMKETKAPAGYTLNTTLYKIDINADLDEGTGLLSGWSVTISAQSSNGTDWEKVGESSFTVNQMVDDLAQYLPTSDPTTDSSTGETTISVSIGGETVEVTLSEIGEYSVVDEENDTTTTYTTYQGTYTTGYEIDGVYTAVEYTYTAVKETVVKTSDESVISTTWDVSGTVTTVATGANDTKILNTQIIELPSTGGMGTILFTVIGCLIMILAASAYIFNRRRNRVTQ